MLNLSLTVYEAITPRKNSQNLMTLLCVTQLNRQRFLEYITLQATKKFECKHNENYACMQTTSF